MKAMWSLFSMLSVILLSSPAFSHDGIGKIKTEYFDLTYADHALAGEILGRPVFSTPLDAEFGVKLYVRDAGQTFEGLFKNNGQEFYGELVTAAANPTTYTLTKIDVEKGQLLGTINNVPFTMTVTADAMEGHHYVNPRFHVEIGEASYDFTLEGGMACMGCIAKLSYALLVPLTAFAQ